jgi:hypothetical protein
MKSDKGRLAKRRIRYIKQVTDSFTQEDWEKAEKLAKKNFKYTITTGSATLQDRRPFTPDKFYSNYWKTFNFPLFFMFVGIAIGLIILWVTLGGK